MAMSSPPTVDCWPAGPSQADGLDRPCLANMIKARPKKQQHARRLWQRRDQALRRRRHGAGNPAGTRFVTPSQSSFNRWTGEALYFALPPLPVPSNMRRRSVLLAFHSGHLILTHCRLWRCTGWSGVWQRCLRGGKCQHLQQQVAVIQLFDQEEASDRIGRLPVHQQHQVLAVRVEIPLSIRPPLQL
jgi:hypothetical protein